MKRLLLFHIIVFSTIISFGQAPIFEWAKQMGDTLDDGGFSIALDLSGNIYTTGEFEGTVDFDPSAGVTNLVSDGLSDVFISKLDPSGNFLWAKKLGGTLYDYGWSNVVDSKGNVYTLGHFYGTADFDPGVGVANLICPGSGYDIFVSKLDSLGNFVWAKNIGGTLNDAGLSIAVDASGNVYSTGYFQGTADFDPNAGIFNMTASGISSDIFISKLDSLGNFEWAKSIGGTFNDAGNSIELDSFGNVYATGIFGGIVDFDPSATVFNLNGPGGDIFILKLDSLGNFVWAKNIGDTYTDTGNSIAIDAIGNVYTSGFFKGTADFDPGIGTFNLVSTPASNNDIFVSKLDALGNFVWAKNMGGTGQDYGYSISIDVLGNIYTTGTFMGVADFDPGSGTSYLTSGSGGGVDVFVSKLDSSGNFVWSKNVGGTSSVSGYSISIDLFNNVYTTGAFQGTADFDPNAGIFNLTSVGTSDIIVHKMNQNIVTNVVAKNDNLTFSIYPNPATNNLTIETAKPTNISIVNLLGQELFNSKIEKSETIDVSFLSNGIYFVKDLQNGGSVKFIKQ